MTREVLGTTTGFPHPARVPSSSRWRDLYHFHRARVYQHFSSVGKIRRDSLRV